MPMNHMVKRPGAALALLVTAQFMVILDVAIVNVALPTIGPDLGFSRSGLQWVVSAYAIVFGGALLLGGRLADLLGRRRVFVGGLLLFALASLVGGFASSQGMLVAARAPPGPRGAVISPAGPPVITTTLTDGADPHQAPRAPGPAG